MFVNQQFFFPLMNSYAGRSHATINFLHRFNLLFLSAALRATLLIFRDFNVWRNACKVSSAHAFLRKMRNVVRVYFGNRCLSLWGTFFWCLFSMGFLVSKLLFTEKFRSTNFTKLFDLFFFIYSIDDRVKQTVSSQEPFSCSPNIIWISFYCFYVFSLPPRLKLKKMHKIKFYQLKILN